MNLLVVLFILMLPVILLLPIPLKIKISYMNRQFIFKIYNFNITDKIKLNRSFSVNTAEKNKFAFFTNTLKSLDFKNLKIRLPMKIDIKLCCGLDNAAHTAIAYGIICSLNIFLFNRLNKIFHIKKYHHSIKPDFNNRCLELEITSIIYISLVKIIYVYIKLYRYKKRSRKSNDSIDSSFA